MLKEEGYKVGILIAPIILVDNWEELYEELIKSNNKYLLELLINNSRNVNLNCLYLIRYGVSDIEKVILTKTEDITKDHDEFIKDIKSLEKELNKKEIIALYENA